jgi:hypothetical protein
MLRFQYRFLLAVSSCFFLKIAPATAQEFRMLSLQLNDICYSPANDRLYGAVPGDRAEGNSIAVIHPLTGAVEQYIPVGSEPSVLRVSANGRYLYVGLHGSPFIQRYDLLSGTLGTPISLEEFFDPPYDNHYPIHAGDIQPLPGDGTSIAVSQRDLNTTPGFYGLSVFDNESERSLTTSSGVSGGDKIVVTEDGQTLWGLGHAYEPAAFRRHQITAQGVVAQNSYPNIIAGGVTHVGYQNGRIYLQNGQIFDVSGGGAPTLLTTIDTGTPHAPMVPALDSSVFYLITDYNSEPPFGFVGYKLRVYDSSDFTLKGFYEMPNDFWGTPKKLLSLGQGRVALLASSSPNQAEKTTLVLFRSNTCAAQDLGLTVTPSVAFPCVGDTLTLQAATGYAQYYWSNGATTQTVKISSSINSFDSLRYRVLAPNGCLSQYSPAAQVQFENKPDAITLQLAAYKNIICPDESAQVFPYEFSGAATAYVFSTGDTIAAGQQLSISEGGIYTVYGISTHGCPSPATSVEIVEAVPNPGPPPSITANGPLVTCGNELTTLSAPAGAFGYHWSNGATTRSITPQWSAGWAVQTVFENGCHSEWSDTLHVEVGFSPSQLQIGESFFVLNISNLSAVGDSVQWYRNGQPIPGATALSYTPTQLGLYTVQNFYQGCPSFPSLPYPFAGTCTANIIAQPGGSPVTQYYLVADPLPEHNYTYLWSNGETSQYVVANGPGEYCLTVTRPADGATASTCLSVVPHDRVRSGAEHAFQPVAGMPILLLKYNAGQIIQQATLTTDATGQVLFENVPPGDYLLQAVPVPGSPLAAQFLPTYFYQNLFWNDAAVTQVAGLALASELPPLQSIRLVPTQMFTGSGSVSGFVQEAPGFAPPENGNIENPLAGVGVFLFNASGMPVAHVFTDANGYFSFGNLPLGTYTLYINLPGIQPFSATVTVSPGNPNPSGIVFSLANGNFSVGAQDLRENALRVWPNPTENAVLVEMPETAALTLRNALGEQLGNWEMPAGRTTLFLGKFPAGVYWLKAQTNGGRIWQQKIVKQ